MDDRIVERAYHETCGALIAYNLIRHEIASAAGEGNSHQPTPVSREPTILSSRNSADRPYARLRKISACLRRLPDRVKSRPMKNDPAAQAPGSSKSDLGGTPVCTFEKTLTERH